MASAHEIASSAHKRPSSGTALSIGNLTMLLEKYAGEGAALAVIDETVREDHLRRERPDACSHEHIVARPA